MPDAVSRRPAGSVLAVAALLLAGACAATPSPGASPPPVSPSPPPSASPTGTVAPSGTAATGKIALRPLATDLSSPLYVADAGDVPGRLYVVEQGGTIRVLENGTVRSEPFLDISDRVKSGGERGLLSVAFPSDYPQSGRFFVDYTDLNGDTVIERYQASAETATGDPSSGTRVLEIDQPFANHNGGLVLFGPDGYLYVGMGDGGSGGDPMDNGQRGDTLLGKMLRLDVNVEPGYRVPPDNPFLSDDAFRDEIWAYGLRNPWRFSFDRETRDMWIGDVGQGSWEEVDFQPASSDGRENYGWARMEGPDCFGGSCDPSDFVLPVVAYAHGRGDCVVTGGYVYRGAAIPDLRGTYLYGDYCSGRIWGLRAEDALAGEAEPELLLDSDVALSSFGEDRAGELYVTDLSGALYQVVPAS